MPKGKLRKISTGELKKILEEHKLWLQSEMKEGKCANFDKADLSRVNFEGADLSGAILSEANMSGAILQDVKLIRAVLRGADLSGSILIGANLVKADLSIAKLEGTNLEKATLRQAILYETILTGANLAGADLSGAVLEKGELKDADFSGASLVGANLCRIKAEGTNFRDADFNKITIDEETLFVLPQEVVDLYLKTFFILGYKFNSDKITRSIEFPPEYHQAGISILNYFGAVLKKKFPDQKAKIRIEQDELKVTMTIDPVEGDPEIIEKALDEYGLVITGNMTLNEYTNDPILTTDLKNQLINAKAQLDMQRNLLVLQGSQVEKKDTQIEQLLSALGQITQNPNRPSSITVAPNFNVSSDISPSLTGHLSQQATIEVAPQISLIQGGLNELKEQLPQGSDEANSVDELQQSMDEIEHSQSKEEVAKSSAMSKFRRFLENVEKAETTAGKVIKTTKGGIDIARKLAGHYNQIAQWCGLPQVPEPFVKK